MAQQYPDAYPESVPDAASDNYQPLNENSGQKRELKDLGAEDRKEYIKKVYAILGCQLLFTALFSIYPTAVDSEIRDNIWMWTRDNIWMLWTCFAFAIASECAILCVPAFAR